MSGRKALRWALVACGLFGWAGAGTARAQGLIIDRHFTRPVARTFEVREVRLDARVKDQVADVRVSQTFHNPGSVAIDAEFLFPLPEDGAVQNFVLMVDGRELPGRLLPKDEARRIYEEIVRSSRDPALLEYMGKGLFRTSVFPIPPGADRTVTMRCTQVCPRDRDVVSFTYPLGTQKFTAKPIQKLALSVEIEGRDAIKSLYSPSHDARTERSGDRSARVTFEERDTVPSQDFRLLVTLATGSVGASVLSDKPSGGEDGYFLLLASPEVRTETGRKPPKSVVFVLDRSGSMSGKKMEQARNALRFVLDNLRDEDLFNIVVYDDRVETFRPELQRYSSRTREEAQRYVDNLRAGGSTNIDAALQTALGQLRDDERPSYVLFLTDGLPTAGEVKEAAIAEHARKANRSRARIFAFGVGFDVNARLLDRLSGGNAGTSVYVKPDEDIEAHVARFYGKLTSPVLAGVKVEFEGTDVNRTYPRDVPDLFEGGQLLLVGRYPRGGRSTLRLSGKVDGERKTFEFPVKLATSDDPHTYDFVEKLWATRRVGDLIDQIDLHGSNKELVDELVALSTRYGLLTPYTSFLADERVSLHASASNAARTQLNLRELEVVSGAAGVEQRGVKQGYLSAARAPAPTAGVMGGYGYVADEAAKKAAPSGFGMMGGGYPAMPGMMAGRAASAPVAAVPSNRTSAGKPDSLVARREGTVRQVGGRTFYRKGDRWVDSTVTEDDEKKATVLRQFSEPYFELARAQKADQNQFLTFDEPVVVNLNGKTYRIEPAAR